jgi:indole-3-glycerol phosphate synthase
MATVDALDDILSHRRRRVAQSKEKTPLSEMEKLAKAAPAPLDFLSAVARPGIITLIAEMKKRSPSAGIIRQPYDPARIASAYEKGGAAAISVLTEPDKFGGELNDIARARKACKLPVLRKDFIFDPYQMPESRAAGADAVLLIADMLPASQLNELAAAAREYGLEPLVEIFSEDVVEAALDTGAKLIGINARNLRTLEMRPDRVLALAPQISADRYVVAESGIKTASDVERLRSMPVFAMLVGESLLKQSDIEKAARKLVQAGTSTHL